MGKVWDSLAEKTYLFWTLRSVAEFSDPIPVVALASRNPCIRILRVPLAAKPRGTPGRLS